MKGSKQIGLNRTGIGTSPQDSKEMLDNSQILPSAPDNQTALINERAHYIADTGQIGTVPPPTSVKGAAKSVLDMAKGKVPMAFLDKLGARLAFERTGTRLYEAFLIKLKALGPMDGIPDISLVRQFHREELSHMELVRQTIENLGADPTAITPAADVDAVASMGLLQVITDPRTDIAQSLHAIHVAELADHDGWELLIQIAESMGHNQIAKDFRKALDEETLHLQHVRSWMTALSLNEAGVTE